MTYFAATTMGIALSAAFIFLLLRIFSGNSHRGNRARNISSHAFWTAVIALFASGVSGLNNLWALPGYTAYGESNWENRVMHAAAPGLWLGIIYLIGQFTWPRHLAPVRSASLEVRSVKRLIPRYLAGLLLLVTLASSLAIATLWNDPGAPGRAGSEQITEQTTVQDSGFETDENGNYLDAEGKIINPSRIDEDGNLIPDENEPFVSSITGVLPGPQVGPYLAGGLALVLISVAVVTAVVARRPPLQTLSAEDNETLRHIWVNRLLRTAVIVAAGFGAMSLQYLGHSSDARNAWLHADAPLDYLGGDSSSNSFYMGSTVAMIAVVITMAAWPPPRLPSALEEVFHASPLPSSLPSPAFAKARDFLLLVQGSLLVAFILAAVIPSASTESGPVQHWETVTVDGLEVQQLVYSSGPPMLTEASGILLGLAVIIGCYLLLQLLANHLIERRLGDRAPLAAPMTNLLPRWFLVLVALAVATGLVFTLSFALSTERENLPVALWALALMGGTAGLAWLTYRAAAGRQALRGASSHEDLRIRVIVAHRGARMLAGVCLFGAAILSENNPWAPNRYADYMESSYMETASGFGPSALLIILIGIGVVLCLLPASTAPVASDFSQQTPERQPV